MNYRFNSIIFVLYFVFATYSLGAENEELYFEGKKAFENGDCVTALTSFTAFLAINKKEIKKHKMIEEGLTERIEICKAFLKKTSSDTDIKEKVSEKNKMTNHPKKQSELPFSRLETLNTRSETANIRSTRGDDIINTRNINTD